MRHRGIRVVPQQENWDCGVAALASLFALPYADVWAASHIVPDHIRLRKGLGVQHLQDIADGFGHTLVRVHRSNGYLLNATGILGLFGSKLHPAGHWVVLDNNNIIEPDGREGHGESWHVLDYLATFDARPCTLLMELE